MADQREMNFFCFTPSTKSKTCEFFLSLLSAKDGKSSGGGGGGGRESSSPPRFQPSVFFFLFFPGPCIQTSCWLFFSCA